MTVIGITGHQSMPTNAREYVREGIREFLGHQDPPLIGLSSLAVGADQLFADELLTTGGTLHAIIPSAGYDNTFSEHDRPHYLELKSRAAEIDVLDYDKPSEDAFDAAGRRVVELCDIMVAVWDGKGAKGQGGTADAVDHARKNGKPIHIIWPAGVLRD